MHELSIAQSILSISEQSIPAGTTARVCEVAVRIGELSGIELDSLEFAFSVIKKNTLLEHATLRVEIVEGEAFCRFCSHQFAFHQYGDSCPQCHSYEISVTGGRELKVTSLIMQEA